MTDAISANIDRPGPAGEEELRFIRNFHDVFLSIGLMIFAAGVGLMTLLLLGERIVLQSIADFRSVGWTIAAAFFIDAAIMWGLAEIFARSRRLFLPAIVILLAFVGFFVSGAFAAYVARFAQTDFTSFQEAATQLRYLGVTVGGATTLAILLYYVRMKLPFAMGLAGVGAAGTTLAALFSFNADLALTLGPYLYLAAGLFLFVLGVAFDARDPARRTRYADNGFWLHFFAAPLIFSGAMGAVVGPGGMVAGAVLDAGAGPAIATLALVSIFAVISLLINRRALLVAGLLSAAIAVGVLVRTAGLSSAWTGAATLLILGAAMVILGGAWRTLRRIITAPFPKTGFWARIIPPADIDDEDR